MTKRGTGGGGGFATERRRYPQGFGLYHIRLCGQKLQHSTAQHGNRLMGFVFPPLGRMSMVQGRTSDEPIHKPREPRQ